jgi:hypothetical protein
VRACYAKERAALKAGYKPKWNCKKWMEETKKSCKKSKSCIFKKKSVVRRKSTSKRSMKKSVRKSRKRSTKRSTKPRKSNKKIYTGARGGKYVVYKDSQGNKRKVYI